MRISLVTLALIGLTILPAYGQSSKSKPFIGMLEYKISVRDSAFRELIPDNRMLVYTNDTIVRIENYTDHLGTQIAIKHIILDKSYLLLETEFGKYALQMDATEDQKEAMEADTTSDQVNGFTFTKKMGKTRMLGRKMSRMMVNHVDFGEPIEFLYMKKYSRKIVDAYPEINGIPVKYSVITTDAIYDYELIKMSEYTPEHDLFGIPSDYERVTFDEFMDKMIQSNSQIEGE